MLICKSARNYSAMNNHGDFCTNNVSVLIREVVEKRLSMYERKEDRPPYVKPDDGLGGPGVMEEPLMDDEFHEQSTSQPQRPLSDRDSLQRTPSDGRYMENVSPQERKLMEEGEDEQTMRKTSGRELLQPRGGFEP